MSDFKRKLRCVFRKTRVNSRGERALQFGIKAGYWPCLKAPFIQLSIWNHYFEIWYGAESYIKPDKPKVNNLVYLRVADDCFHVFTNNQMKIAELICDMDGYYKVFPEPKMCERGGYIPTYILCELTDYTDKLNEKWENHLNDYFKT